MKRILSILLSVTLVCLLAACGAPAQQGGDAPQADAAPMRALRLGTGSVGGTDNVAMGRKLAELVDEAVPPEQKIGVMGHVEGARTAVERRDGLVGNVAGGMERVAALDYCDGSEIVSRQRTKEMLIAHPEIRCMVGLNESSALGVANAIRDLGLEGKVGLIACDSSEKQIQFMEQGTIQAFVIQNPFNMGYLSVSNTVSILQGRTVPEVVNTDSVIIKKEDLYKKENQKLMFPFTSVE